ncbi:hypothetical protein [Halochromatium glycolicum]|uniref:Ribonucleotide reductase subunit alpha n=1 Tax=Halochromatium glycolicum TaxID=85075 RepID=A0AAJ0XAM7_9GAMM|nr:hypothetical protein [Halochromatium glycolicum]MBK1705007.1 ribonucleotide reductase subunit alpha [Halochromatium glycolicum]
MLRNFQDLLDMAAMQDEPQRLLLVLAKTDSESTNGSSQRTGTISPVICNDKLPSEIESFAALVAEADEITQDWDLILIASLDGERGHAPSSEQAQAHLNKMVSDVQNGQDLSRYLILDRQEQVVTMRLRDGVMMI